MRTTNRLKKLTFITFMISSLKVLSLPIGEFTSNCFPHGEGLKNSFRSEVRIEEGRFEGTFLLFEGPKCQKQVLSVDYTAQMNFPENLESGPLDKRVGKAFLLVFDENWRQKLNATQGCGGSELVLNVPLEIQGLPECGPFPVPKSGTFIYDFFKREEGSFSLGAYPLLWITDESRRPVLTSRIEYSPKSVIKTLK